jgi:NAD(P)-dependent dehydrogenase (short-subunit alcohol dehydrogenase family)
MRQTAVVTGAGSGVGRAVALALAERGYNVVVVGRREDALRETIALGKKGAGEVVHVACDVSRAAEVAGLAERVRERFGDAAVLVNSAGTNVAQRSLEQLSPEDFQTVIDVNLTGAFLCIHALLPGMRRRGGGTIVNVISDAGLWGNAISGAAYIASKFGLTGLTETVNIEEHDHGIRACAVFPGEINTPLLDRRPVPPPMEKRQKMLQAEDVAACVMLAIDLPDRAVVEKLIVRPRER